MKKKSILSCSKCGSRNYSTVKSGEHRTGRLEMKKYCKSCNEHTVHQETK